MRTMQKYKYMDFPGSSDGKEPTCQCKRCRRHGFYPWIGKVLWKRAWQPTPVFLPVEFHGQRSLSLQTKLFQQNSNYKKYIKHHPFKLRQQLTCWVIFICPKIPWGLHMNIWKYFTFNSDTFSQRWNVAVKKKCIWSFALNLLYCMCFPKSIIL